MPTMTRDGGHQNRKRLREMRRQMQELVTAVEALEPWLKEVADWPGDSVFGLKVGDNKIEFVTSADARRLLARLEAARKELSQ